MQPNITISRMFSLSIIESTEPFSFLHPLLTRLMYSKFNFRGYIYNNSSSCIHDRHVNHGHIKYAAKNKISTLAFLLLVEIFWIPAPRLIFVFLRIFILFFISFLIPYMKLLIHICISSWHTQEQTCSYRVGQNSKTSELAPQMMSIIYIAAP